MTVEDLIRDGAERCNLDLDRVLCLPIPAERQVWYLEYRSNFEDKGPYYVLWRYEEIPEADTTETHFLEIPEEYAPLLSSMLHASSAHIASKDVNQGSFSLRQIAEQMGIANDLENPEDDE